MSGVTYSYQARNLEGNAVSGAMVADSTETVVARLRARALYVTWVGDASSLHARASQLRPLGGRDSDPLAAFFRAFATLLGAAMPIQRALAIAIERCSDARLAEALSAVAAEVEAGHSLASAMRTRPRDFDDLHVALIEAGETGGTLDAVLERLSTIFERDRAIRKKLAAALAYPAIVLAAAFGLALFVIATVVPTFSVLFVQLGVDVPTPTRFLLAAGTSLRDPHVIVAGTAVGFAAAIAVLRYSRSLPEPALERLILRLPILGSVRRSAIVARAARTLGLLLHSGVDILHAFEVAAPVCGSALFANALLDVRTSVRDGEGVASRMQRSELFDPFAIGLIRVGEETGALDAMFLKIAEVYEVEVDATLATLGATLEPILIIVIGAIVGAITASVFIPLYSVIGQIR
jgi:type IV pilus assembly protein PilC